MADAKSAATGVPAETFIDGVEPQARRDEARQLDALFRKATGQIARMWGPGIIGYGEYCTTYETGRAVHWMRSGFSPRKAKHVLYLQGGYCDDSAAAVQSETLSRLGKHSVGKSCLYVNRLADIDIGVLEEIITADWQTMQRLYPEG